MTLRRAYQEFLYLFASNTPNNILSTCIAGERVHLDGVQDKRFFFSGTTHALVPATTWRKIRTYSFLFTALALLLGLTTLWALSAYSPWRCAGDRRSIWRGFLLVDYCFIFVSGYSVRAMHDFSWCMAALASPRQEWSAEDDRTPPLKKDLGHPIRPRMHVQVRQRESRARDSIAFSGEICGLC